MWWGQGFLSISVLSSNSFQFKKTQRMPPRPHLRWALPSQIFGSSDDQGWKIRFWNSCDPKEKVFKTAKRLASRTPIQNLSGGLGKALMPSILDFLNAKHKRHQEKSQKYLSLTWDTCHPTKRWVRRCLHKIRNLLEYDEYSPSSCCAL